MTACFFGEWAVAEGEFHETMNLAAAVATARMAVVFPAPFGPRNPVSRPGAAEKRAVGECREVAEALARPVDLEHRAVRCGP